MVYRYTLSWKILETVADMGRVPRPRELVRRVVGEGAPKGKAGSVYATLSRLRRRGLIEERDGWITLTNRGRAALSIVRAIRKLEEQERR